MRMAKIVLTLFLLAVLGIAGVSVYFRSSPDMAVWNHNSNNLSPLAERSDDDISYSQEVRTLTARLKQQADEAKEKDQARQREIDNLRQQLREQSTSTNSKLNQEVQGLAERNNALNRQNSELQAQMAQMQETLGQMQARQEEMANREPPDVSAQVAAELAKITGKTPEEVRAGATDKDTKRDDTPRENVFTGLLEEGKNAVNNLTGEDNKPPPLRASDVAGCRWPRPFPALRCSRGWRSEQPHRDDQPGRQRLQRQPERQRAGCHTAAAAADALAGLYPAGDDDAHRRGDADTDGGVGAGRRQRA